MGYDRKIKKTTLATRLKHGTFLLFMSLTLVCLSHSPVRAQELVAPSPPTEPALHHSPNDPLNDEIDDESDPLYRNLPDIEAKSFAVKILDRSSSNRVYLFEDSNTRVPAPGRILLLKREDNQIMAFRVLKNYSDKNAFAAKRVRRYPDHRVLQNEESYLAIEKIADLNPSLTSEDESDLDELEVRKHLKVVPYDPELDKEIAPLSEEEIDKIKKGDQFTINPEDQDIHPELSIEESQIIDHFFHWLTVGVGFVSNGATPPSGFSSYFSAANVRYGLTLGRMVFFDRPRLQDSIVIEGGPYFYKALNFATQGDAYSILSLAGVLRYNLMFSRSFGIFFYGGVFKTSVISSTQSQASTITSLSKMISAFGGGLLFELGPSWYTRVELGYESIGANLVLRF